MNWSLVELQWQEKWVDELTGVTTLAPRVHDFVERVATCPQLVDAVHSPAIFVERLLLHRLGQDFRAVDMLALGGHGPQAMSAAGTLFEVAHVLVDLAGDDDGATRWLKWTNTRQAPRKVAKLVKQSAEKLGWSKARKDEEYDWYSFACLFKHMNPFAARLQKLPHDADVTLGQLAVARAAYNTVAAVGYAALVRLNGQVLLDLSQEASDLLDAAQAAVPKVMPTMDEHQPAAS